MDIMAQSASDAFAEFVLGTKSASDAFRAMAQSMVASLVRISSQKAFEQLFGSIASGASGLFRSLFGGGSTPTGMTTNSGNSWTNYGAATRGGSLHTGGMGYEASMTRSIPAYMISTAPRYHDGIGPGERAAVIRDDEGVFTPGQMKALGSRSLSINVPVSIDSGYGFDERRLPSRLRDEIEDTAKRVLREEMR
jgi:hypothetical protein